MIDLVKQALEEERCWTVYIHISPSNKLYVGITSQTVDNRWKNGYGYKDQPFYRAIEKYGWENFQHEIIASNLTEDEANAFEIALIRELDTLMKNGKGYNTTEGGKGTKGFNTDRSKYTGKNATRKRSVICLNTMEVFECIIDAKRKYNTTEITPHCLHKRNIKFAGKDPITGEKMMWDYYDEELPIEHYEKVYRAKLERLNTPHKCKGNSHVAKKLIRLSDGLICHSKAELKEKFGSGELRRIERGERICEWAYLTDYERVCEDLGITSTEEYIEYLKELNNEREAM